MQVSLTHSVDSEINKSRFYVIMVHVSHHQGFMYVMWTLRTLPLSAMLPCSLNNITRSSSVISPLFLSQSLYHSFASIFQSISALSESIIKHLEANSSDKLITAVTLLEAGFLLWTRPNPEPHSQRRRLAFIIKLSISDAYFFRLRLPQTQFEW